MHTIVILSALTIWYAMSSASANHAHNQNRLAIMYILLLSLLVFSVLNNNNRRRASHTRAKNNPLLPDIDIDFERFVYQHTASMLANSNNDINEQDQTQIEEDTEEEDTEEEDTEKNSEEEEYRLPPISGPPLVRKSNCQII